MKQIFSAILIFTAHHCFSQIAKIEFLPSASSPVINRQIYGFFSEHIGSGIYQGIFAGNLLRKDVVTALAKIHPANLRWPGGRFAEDYHWRDGIGDTALRPKRINKHWGNVTENNHFGTMEYLSFCDQIGADPVVVANLQTGTASEMAGWLNYLKGQALYWHIGNQSWAYMDSISYAKKFVEYTDTARNTPGGSKLKLIAVGPGRDDVKWTRAMMKRLPLKDVWGLSFHHYVYPMDANGKNASSSSDFNEQEYFSAVSQSLGMDSLIRKHTRIMDQYDPGKKIALVVGEWGIRVKDSLAMVRHGNVFQYGTLRDAICAATMLNVFNRNAERIRMANLAQTVNVLHSVILTNGNEMVRTPTYYVFELMKVHQDAELVNTSIKSPKYTYNGRETDAVNVSASKKNGALNITLVNVDPHNSVDISLPITHCSVIAQILTSSSFTSMNVFGKQADVKLMPFNDFKRAEGNLLIKLPAKSIVQLDIKK